MKSRQLAGLIAGATLSFSTLASDVGVSISIGQPGFYGRLDIGGFPAPAVIYREPVVIVPGPVVAPVVYLRVPPGHRKRWAHFCGDYGACAQRVYFVSHDWYEREYVPRYHRRHHGYPERVVYVEHKHHAPHAGRGGPPRWSEDRHRDGRGRGNDRKHKHGRDRD